MTRRTRYFLVGSAAVVVLGLGTGLVAYYNGGLPLGSVGGTQASWPTCRPTRRRSAMPTSARHHEFGVPAEAAPVLPTGEELAKFKDELGVDIEHDIDTVIGGLPGRRPTRSAAAW